MVNIDKNSPDIGIPLELAGTGTYKIPYMKNVSSARLQMANSHMSQAVVVEKNDTPWVMTGIELQEAPYNICVKMPEDGIIRDIVRKYPKAMGLSTQIVNTIDYIIYENPTTGQYGSVTLPLVFKNHKTFGFEFQFNGNIDITPNSNKVLRKGTILATSKNTVIDKETGNMVANYGFMANVAYMTIPEIIEDGFLVYDEFLKGLNALGIGEETIEINKDYYPLNLYGDENNYKPFPDTGETIRPDGLLMVLRKVRPDSLMMDTTPSALMKIDTLNDKPIYAQPGATIYDIDVYRDRNAKNNVVPDEFLAQAQKYADAIDRGYEQLVGIEKSLYGKYGQNIPLSKNLNILLTYAHGNRPGDLGGKVNYLYRFKPINGWSINIKYKYNKIPNLGYKLTDRYGNKGVAVVIGDRSKMPKDRFGNVADVVIDPASVLKRQNSGQLFEQYLCAQIREARDRVRAGLASGNIDNTWNELLEFYQMTSPMVYDIQKELITNEDKLYHLEKVAASVPYLVTPTDTPGLGLEQTKALEERWPLPVGPVTYINAEGKEFTTKTDVIIAPKYMMLLEKTPTECSAVAVPLRQHHGLPAKSTKADRSRFPVNKSSQKFIGEAEGKLLMATVRGHAVRDIMELSNNPYSMEEVIVSILESEQPTNVYDHGGGVKEDGVVGSRAVGNAKGLVYCSGVKLKVRKRENG